MRHASIHELDALLISRRQWERAGGNTRSIRVAVDAGRMHRLRRGWFMHRSDWDDLWPESRHRAEVLAAAHSSTGRGPVFSHLSAAVLWGLPLVHIVPERVHVTLDGSVRHSIPGLMRHRSALPFDDVAEISGVRCTSLLRTVDDVVRTVAPEAALALTDAALATKGGQPWDFDLPAAEEWADQLRMRAARPGARGAVQARQIADLADGRAQLPLESMTRWRLHQLGFERPRLQVPVPAAGGRTYWMDLGLPQLRTFVECDGAMKYLDPEMRGGRGSDRVVLDEKIREDWVRGATGWRVIRVGAEDMRTIDSAAATFRAFGLHPHRRREPFAAFGEVPL
ncbi:hypothetical protein ACIQTT_14730 [Microbacterium sp. NPDC090225]|uniref:hypothetical protein n=1 Tax=Microbacterium sp. NPDC090225 TaxID=3364207 RepID=UPI0038200928